MLVQILAAYSLTQCLAAATAAEPAELDLAEKVNKLIQRADEQERLMLGLTESRQASAQARRLLVDQTTQLYDGMPSIFGPETEEIQYDFKMVNGTRAYTEREQVQESLRHVWLILMGAIAFMMQAGFALLEAGYSRFVHVEHTLMKNILTTLIGAIMWWVCGYSFAFSGRFREDDLIRRADKPLFKENALFGKEQFIGHHFLFGREDGQVEPTVSLVEFFYTWTFCATATTIATGAMIERVRLPAYMLFSVLVSGFIYPFAAGWTVGLGWIADTTSSGYYDWAGGGYVHMLGGTIGLIAAVVSGPREGRFDDNVDLKTRVSHVPEQFWPHSQMLIALGTLLIWLGFYGLFCGANNLMESVEDAFMTAHVAMILTIGATVGAATAATFRFVHAGMQYDMGAMSNGLLAGAVSVSAGCSTMNAGEALAAAIIGTILYYFVSLGIKAIKVDDPLDVFAVHGATGIWSLYAAIIFDWGMRFEAFSGFSGFRCYRDSPPTGPDSRPSAVWRPEDCVDVVQAAWAANTYYVLSVPLMALVLACICLLPMRFVGIWTASREIQAKGHDPELYGHLQAYTPYWQKNDPQEDENYL